MFKFELQLFNIIFSANDFHFKEDVSHRHLVFKLVRLEVWGINTVHAICMLPIIGKCDGFVRVLFNAIFYLTFVFNPTLIVHHGCVALVFSYGVNLGRLLHIALAVVSRKLRVLTFF